MQEINFFIPGKVQGKQRPKFSRVGSFVKTYTPQETANYETFIKWTYTQEVGSVYFEGKTPLEMELIINQPVPESASNKFKERALNGFELPTKKPDLDNVVKIVCDALNKTAYQDDSQIISLLVRKKYSKSEGLHVKIKPIVGLLF